MLVTTLTTVVHAQMETVWGLLLDRLHNPQHYNPTVRSVKVQETFSDGLVRELEMGGMTVRERININKRNREMNTEILSHPLYTGTTTLRLVPSSVQNPMAPLSLEYFLKLERKSLHLTGLVRKEDELVAAMRDEMNRIKEKAERQEQDRQGKPP